MLRRSGFMILVLALGLGMAGSVSAAAPRHRVDHWPAYFGAAKGLYSVPHGPHHPLPR